MYLFHKMSQCIIDYSDYIIDYIRFKFSECYYYSYLRRQKKLKHHFHEI
jgi:hypothetical protein